MVLANNYPRLSARGRCKNVGMRRLLIAEHGCLGYSTPKESGDYKLVLRSVYENPGGLTHASIELQNNADILATSILNDTNDAFPFVCARPEVMQTPKASAAIFVLSNRFAARQRQEKLLKRRFYMGCLAVFLLMATGAGLLTSHMLQGCLIGLWIVVSSALYYTLPKGKLKGVKIGSQEISPGSSI